MSREGNAAERKKERIKKRREESEREKKTIIFLNADNTKDTDAEARWSVGRSVGRLLLMLLPLC